MENREKISLNKTRRIKESHYKMKDIRINGNKNVNYLSKQFLVLIVFILIIFFSISLTLAYTRSAVQYTQYKGPSAGFLSGEDRPDRTECEAGQDFVIQIAPFGCTPAVVRTDLLEEQNVPVFCQLAATKLNPLIDVEAIDSISFSGKYPKEIQGIGFHPAQSALGIKEKLNSPILENIGYAVIVLKKQPDTKDIPDYVQGTMTAKIKYDIKNAFGIGKTTFYLPIIKDSEWEDRKSQYSFWNGKGYLRAEDIDDDNAKISVYDDLRKITSMKLKRGEKSEDIFLPSMSDCLATMDLKLESLEYPGTRAKLNINGEIFEFSDEEKFLDNECRVTNIENKGLVKEVSISCDIDDIETGRTKTERFTLKTNPGIKLKINDKENNYNYKIGDKLDISEKNFYLGFIDTKKNSEEEKDLYALVVEMPSDKSFDDKTISSIVSYNKRCIVVDKGEISKSKNCKDDDWVIKDIIKGGNITLVKYNEENKKINDKSIKLIGYSEPLNNKLSGDAEKNYNLAMSDFESVTDNYPSEKDPTDETSVLAEEAFLEAIYLNYETGQKLKTKELCEKFKEKYSEAYEEWDLDRQFCDDVRLSDVEIPSHDVIINGKTKVISLEGIIEPDEDEYKLVIDVMKDNKILPQVVLTKNDIDYIKNNTGEIVGTIKLEELNENSARVKITVYSEKGNENPTEKTLILKKDSPGNVNNYIFSISEINLKKMAKVSVNPNIKNAETEANFTFKIGIEKRMIKLSPEQTKEKIENLDENIKDWESKTEKLGNVVQGMKGACLATSTVLIAKNFLANTGGKGIARQDVMNEWRDKCQGLITDKRYSDYDGCFAGNAEQIEKDVENLQKIQESSNKNFDDLQKGCTEKSPLLLFGDTIINDECVKNKLFDSNEQIINKNKLDESIKKCFSDVKIKEGEIQKIEDITKLITKSSSQVTSIRDLNVMAESCKDEKLKFLFNDSLKKELTDIWVNNEESALVSSMQDELKKEDFGDVIVESYGGKDSIDGTYHGKRINGDKISTDVTLTSQEYPYEIIRYNNKNYLLILDGSGSTYNIKYVFDYNYANDGVFSVSNQESSNTEIIKSAFRKFVVYDSSSYSNQFKSVAGENEVVIKLYDTEPYKGYPALVPFDRTNGWYAAIRQTLPVLGNIKSYESSGRVHSFYLCNVGSDGIAEFFSGINEDNCHMINPGMQITTFSGLSKEQTEKLAECAINAIEQVSRVSVKGAKTGSSITINTKCGGSWPLKIGKPAVEVPEMQCQDFMSVKDCQIMYNVCDPVICPSSRCDLGGAYPVTNVIQQGIIGGIALCLPNFNPDPMKGVVVPVCLSGVHAGLEGWVSILKNHRDCLQESLDTGKIVGVCDEIYSIYKCEFFWRQGLPVAKMAIPKLLERLYGQGTRGGGEYLGIQSAWDNAEKSVDYFTQYYGANSFEAFKSRTVEEIGEESCRLSVSASYPDGGNILDTLTEPDSPPQFHGRFDETPFSDVTVPPISHYKVFYHIYAGKSSRAYYQVYLKGSPESTYYKDTRERLVVASGYIATGGYASETKDFTATSGYKDMCIVVNGQEECGFKEVSTSFAINYVKDKYMEEQASQRDIKTETECISGSRSAYALINPSMQGAADELASPSLYNRGITRICATDNPGKGTDSNANANGSRWVDVGYCGNEKLKCWLDMNSVEDVIKNLDIEAETLEKMNKQNIDILKQSGKYLSDDEVKQKIDEIEKLTKSDEKISKINEILDKVLMNNHKAKLYLERGKAYGELAEESYDKVKEEEKVSATTIYIEGEKILTEKGISVDCYNNCYNDCYTIYKLSNYCFNKCINECADETTKKNDKKCEEYCINGFFGEMGKQTTEQQCNLLVANPKFSVPDFLSITNYGCCCFNKEEKISTIHLNDCISDAYWVDKSFKKIDITKDVFPGTIYIKLDIKSLSKCWGYYVNISDNKRNSDIIFIDGTNTKLAKIGNYYYLSYEISLIKKGFMNYDSNKYAFKIYNSHSEVEMEKPVIDSNDELIFSSSPITVDRFYAF